MLSELVFLGTVYGFQIFPKRKEFLVLLYRVHKVGVSSFVTSSPPSDARSKLRRKKGFETETNSTDTVLLLLLLQVLFVCTFELKPFCVLPD